VLAERRITGWTGKEWGLAGCPTISLTRRVARIRGQGRWISSALDRVELENPRRRGQSPSSARGCGKRTLMNIARRNPRRHRGATVTVADDPCRAQPRTGRNLSAVRAVPLGLTVSKKVEFGHVRSPASEGANAPSPRGGGDHTTWWGAETCRTLMTKTSRAA